MPTRLPDIEIIRRMIAAEAARACGTDPADFLPLIDRIELVPLSGFGPQKRWRLTSYFGSIHQIAALERACQVVQRKYPLARE